MKDSKLVILLKSLKSDEFRWFYKFIRSPYYNSNKHLVKLYELLRKYYPDFDHPKLTQEVLFAKLFPGEKYDIPRMRLLFHRFSNLIESFMVAEHIKKDDFLHKKLLTQSLGRINTYDLFQKKTNELLEELENSPYRDEVFFKNKGDICRQFYSHPATNRQNKGAEYLRNTMESFDTYFVLSKVKLACALGARATTFSEQNDIKYLDMVLEKGEWENLLISIYSRIFELQNVGEDDERFEKIKELYTSNLDKIRIEDKRNLLNLLINYCTRRYNKGESRFIQYMLELYKVGLDSDALLINNEISETTFINIVSSGVVCQEFKWVKSFIEEYGDHLDKNVREDAIIYAKIIWHFNKREFEETIQLISNYSFTKPLQVLITKTILIRVYVELFWENDSFFDLSLAQLRTFAKYIRNNKTVPESVKGGYLSFVRYTRRLVNLKFQNRNFNKLKSDLEAARNVSMKSWLISKIN